jgi:hypothetical protein
MPVVPEGAGSEYTDLSRDTTEDVLLEEWVPLDKGNPDTGEVVIGDLDFSEDYTGVDYRVDSNRVNRRATS